MMLAINPKNSVNADGMIFVCCPGNFASGGPELMHQLVDALRSVGRDAFISYFPFGAEFQCPAPYRHYNAPQSSILDEPGNLVILPETNTKLTSSILKARIAIFWASVDFYLGTNGESLLLDPIRYLYTAIFRRRPLARLRNYRHFVQSAYAADFLSKAGIASERLSDYLSEDHLRSREVRHREDVIVFNPRKGQRRTAALRNAYPDLHFVPIAGMSRLEVAQLLSRAKVYIDFGNHPGKDRLPREAAVAGCCVVTGRRGSAGFFEDIPIPDTYKLNDRTDEYLHSFRSLIEDIFQNWDFHSAIFDSYRAQIRMEPTIFKSQILASFASEQGGH